MTEKPSLTTPQMLIFLRHCITLFFFYDIYHCGIVYLLLAYCSSVWAGMVTVYAQALRYAWHIADTCKNSLVD